MPVWQIGTRSGYLEPCARIFFMSPTMMMLCWHLLHTTVLAAEAAERAEACPIAIWSTTCRDFCCAFSNGEDQFDRSSYRYVPGTACDECIGYAERARHESKTCENEGVPEAESPSPSAPPRIDDEKKENLRAVGRGDWLLAYIEASRAEMNETTARTVFFTCLCLLVTILWRLYHSFRSWDGYGLFGMTAEQKRVRNFANRVFNQVNAHPSSILEKVGFDYSLSPHEKERLVGCLATTALSAGMNTTALSQGPGAIGFMNCFREKIINLPRNEPTTKRAFTGLAFLAWAEYQTKVLDDFEKHVKSSYG